MICSAITQIFHELYRNSEVNDAKDLNLNLGADGNAERDRADLQPDAGDCLETPWVSYFLTAKPTWKLNRWALLRPTIPQGPHPKFPYVLPDYAYYPANFMWYHSFAFRGKNEFDLQGDNSKQRGQIRKATRLVLNR